MVAQAAAKNLTPVTLELGGKSPAILDPSSDLATVAPRLAFGKLLNAGQTCIAPDYAFVPKDRIDAFVEQMQRAVSKLYPSLAANPDYTSIVNDRHFARLQGLLEDARAKGARIVTINPAGETLDPARRKQAPVLVLGATPEMKVMQEEIFGPILPVLAYERIDEAIAYINRHDRPLALYWFGSDNANRDKVLAPDDLRRGHAERLHLAHRAGGPALRRRGRQRHRLLPRRMGLSHVQQGKTGVHPAGTERHVPDVPAVRQDLRAHAGPAQAHRLRFMATFCS